MANPKYATLVAGQVTTVTLDGIARRITVLNVSGSAAVYFTTDGSTPVADTNGSWCLPAAVGSLDLVLPEQSTATAVKLISAGTPKVMVGMLQ